MSTFTLRPVPPFRLDLTVSVLRRLAINEMDRWDGQIYSRVLALEEGPIRVSVMQTGPPENPELIVNADAREPAIAAALDKLLGLNVDLTGLYRMAESDAQLAALIGRFAGAKPPRFPSVFEALINGIACQQLSLTVGITLLNRLCNAFVPAVGDHHTFPQPEDLAGGNVEDLKRLGFSTRKAENILTISQAAATGELDLEGLSMLDNAAAIARLRELRGVGRWTAEYVALRGLGRLDVFPADDLGGQTKLQHWLNLETRPDYETVQAILTPWAPYRGIIYFYLLLSSMGPRAGAL